MKKLPIGIQEFSKLIETNCIYVDKTEQIFRMLEHEYYFLSRPRRFGKSLLLNTIKEIFLGNKELFKGLWIYDKIDWKAHPVIKISFSNIDYKTVGLEKAIELMLTKIAEDFGLQLSMSSYALKFDELIKKLAAKEKVVILIDEYDKPIIDYLENLKQAESNRETLKNFYSIIKDADRFIRFFFITGVSKFSKVSIFSDINHLEDITIHDDFSTMLGWTQEELEHYFSDYIAIVEKRYAKHYSDIKPVIKQWYNGYSWDGVNFVYNPVSLLNLFSKRVFNNYWFSTGTPTFLMKLIKDDQYTAFDIEKKDVNIGILEKYDLNNMTLLPLLVQTGYLTIKQYDFFTNIITLDYPNKEVADSFSRHILSELTEVKLDKTDMMLGDIAEAFTNKDIEKVIDTINILFRNIPYTLIDEKEKYYHSIFYTVLKLLGVKIEAEILTIDGRIDAVVKTKNSIIIIEFKINQSADVAINQILEKGYAKKYQNDNRPKFLLGINFDTETKRADDYRYEAFDR
ncbi:MAG: ATP-binding protein [Bacteroidales bacterium]|nr:ATP-binding protein [Bacteroidales bacterium]MCF8457994.1 ATP-binding protein [Bacteroidales bacterium]